VTAKETAMTVSQNSAKSQVGFGLVEIMVGMVISMLAVLVIMQVFALFEGQKRGVTGTSDAQTNGALALYTVERDIHMAGYGVNLPSVLGCTVNASYDGAAPVAPSPVASPFKLTPVVITKGANGLPDTVQVLYSSKANFSIPARITTDHPPQAVNFFLNTTLGIAPSDMMIAYEAGKDCTLIQVTGIPNGNVQIHHSNASSPWNPPGGQNIFPAGGYSTNGLLFDLGTLIIHSYSIGADSSLQLTAFSSSDNTLGSQPLFPDIVNLKAQYGFDTRGSQPDIQVDRWSDTMIDADGSGTLGDAGDIQRIYAVRMAIVARSGLIEKPAADGTCSLYSGAHPQLQKPSWTAADSNGALQTTTIDVSHNPDGSVNTSWQCYRYKTFEALMPMRNLIWSQT
jgi:type IV pilus assembly protein PilW